MRAALPTIRISSRCSPIPRRWRKSAQGTLRRCSTRTRRPARSTVAPSRWRTRLGDDRVLIAKWIRRLTNWNGRQAPMQSGRRRLRRWWNRSWRSRTRPWSGSCPKHQRIAGLREPGRPDHARAGGQIRRRALAAGRARGVARTIAPQCSLVETCKQLATATGTALLWRRLNLVDEPGVPTLRGRVVSFFSQGDGLAIAAALEDDALSAGRIDLRHGQSRRRLPLLRRGESLGRPAGHRLP